MSTSEPAGRVEVQEAVDRLPALDRDVTPVEGWWARRAEVDPAPPLSFDLAVRVHVASR